MIVKLKQILMESGCSSEITDELTKKIAVEIGRTMVPKKEFNEKVHFVKQLQQQLLDAEAEIEHLREAADSGDVLNNQLANLQKKYDAGYKELRKNFYDLKLDLELDMVLMETGAKNLKAVKALLDLNQIDTSEKKGVMGLENQLKKLMDSDPYLFKPCRVKKARRTEEKRGNR